MAAKAKTKGEDGEARLLVSPKVIADALATTQNNAMRMRRDGIIPGPVSHGKYDLIATTSQYVKFLKNKKGTSEVVDGTSFRQEQAMLARGKRFDDNLDRLERMGELVKLEIVAEMFEALGLWFRNEYMNAVKSAIDEYPGDRDEARGIFEPWSRRLLQRVCDRISELGGKFVRPNGASGAAKPGPNGRRVGKRVPKAS